MGKYDKYIIPGTWQSADVKHDALLDHMSHPAMLMANKHIHPDSKHHIEVFAIFGTGPAMGCGTKMEGEIGGMKIEDWPNWHPTLETFIYIGTDPHNMEDLGGEIEFWMGEGKDAEKIVFSKPTTLQVPSNMLHTPIYITKFWRPFLMIVIQEGGDWKGGFKNIYPPDFEYPPEAVWGPKNKKIRKPLKK